MVTLRLISWGSFLALICLKNVDFSFLGLFKGNPYIILCNNLAFRVIALSVIELIASSNSDLLISPCVVNHEARNPIKEEVQISYIATIPETQNLNYCSGQARTDASQLDQTLNYLLGLLSMFMFNSSELMRNRVGPWERVAATVRQIAFPLSGALS